MKIFIKFRHLAWYFLLCISINTIQAQETSKLMAKANLFFNANAFEEAIPIYRDILMLDNNFEAKTRLAEAYRQTQEYDKAEYWYEKILSEKAPTADDLLKYGQILQINGKYEDAKKWFLKFAEENPWGNQLAEGCDRVDEFSAFKQDYEVKLLPFNSPNSDFGAIPFKEGIIFCSNRGDAGSKSKAYNDLFFTSEQLGNSYTPPEKIKGKVNSVYNDGPATLNPEQSQILFTRNAYYKGQKLKLGEKPAGLSIFTANLSATGDKWSGVVPFQHNGGDYSVAHPTITSDGQNLYFVSDMPGGYGGMDIYISTRIDSIWSNPLNLGPNINTPGNDLFPVVHADGTLYFASNGHPGLGGLDLFLSRRVRGVWQVPENLGKPFNSSRDDFGVWLNKEKNQGYFSSNRADGIGSDDIYEVKLDVPNAVNYGGPQKPDFATKGVVTEVLLNDKMGISKIYFESGNWELLPETKQEVDKIYAFLVQNPRVGVEVVAHTDSRGDDFVNMEVSKKRADAIRAYLMTRNVSPDKIRTKGLGETQLLNHCFNGMTCSGTQHEVNSRVEIKAVAIDGQLPDIRPLASPTASAKPNAKNKSKTKSPKTPKKPREKVVKTNPAINTSGQPDHPTFESANATKAKPPKTKTPKPKKEKKPKKERKTTPLDMNASTPNTPSNKPPKELTETQAAKLALKEARLAEKNAAKAAKLAEKEAADKAKEEAAAQTDVPVLTPISQAEKVSKPVYETAADLPPLNYRVYVAPFKSVTNDIYYRYVELNTDVEMKQEGTAMAVVLGPFDTLAKAEEIANYARITTPEKKIKVVVKAFEGETPFILPVKKLKKLGVE